MITLRTLALELSHAKPCAHNLGHKLVVLVSVYASSCSALVVGWAGDASERRLESWCSDGRSIAVNKAEAVFLVKASSAGAHAEEAPGAGTL